MSPRKLLFVPAFTAIFISALATNAQDTFKSGPQVGQAIAGSFSPYNINGKFGKKVEKDEVTPGRHHCLVLDYELKPVVLVFAREPKDDKFLTDLLKQIDEAIEKDKKGTSSLRSFVVFLSPFGTDSVIEATLPEEKKTKEPAKLIELAIGRKGFLEKLDQRAAPLKNVIVTCYDNEGPAGYKIDPKAELTVILYENFKVKHNFAFQENQITQQSVEEMMQAVNGMVGKVKKTEEKPK